MSLILMRLATTKRNWKIPTVDKDMKKKNSCYTIVGNIHWCCFYENYYRDSIKEENEFKKI